MVSFTLSASSPADGPQDGYVAFWLNTEDYATNFLENDVAEDWSKIVTNRGLTFLGNRPNFRGFVVVFFAKQGKAMMAGMWHDGTRSLSVEELVASTEAGGSSKEVDWVTAGTEVRLRVGSTGKVACRVRPYLPERFLMDSTWGWAPDGVEAKSNVILRADGSMVPDGSWSLKEDNLLHLEFVMKSHKLRYVLRLEGLSRAVVVRPDRKPRAAMFLHDTRAEWQEAFALSAGTIAKEPRTFIGFTGWTGSDPSVKVDLLKLTTQDAEERAEDIYGIHEL